MTAPAAVFEHVSKDYKTGMFGLGRLRAVTDVSLTIPTGQVYGLLGPNRAGKTTLVKILLTLCRATSGTVQRLGAPTADRRTLGRVGYVHEHHAFPRYLTPAALLEYYGALSLAPFDQVKKRVPMLLERVGLADRAADPIRTFSKGMTQRLGIAQALINDPDLLVLDEPNEGLDLSGRQLMMGIVQEHRERGRTVILVSHVVPEVEQLCDRIAVLVGGRLAYDGPVMHPLDKALGDIYGGAAGMNVASAIIRDVFRQARASGLTAALIAVALIATGICLSIMPTAPESGGFELSAGLGRWPVAQAATLPAVVANLQFALAALVADTAGVLLALIWTAGFLPSFLDSNSASVLLAKPTSRVSIFTARFAAIVAYVAIFATSFVALTYFAIGIRTGVWTANYWLCVPLMVAHFAVFYSFSALLAVMSRNTTVCIVGSIVFWALCWGMNYGRHVLAGVQAEDIQRAAGGLSRIADIAYWIMPKPADFSLVLADALGADAATGGWPAFRAVREAGQYFPLASILSSLASGAVILALAAFEFVHDEY